MESDKKIALVYDLVEAFDFAALSDKDKAHVLSVISRIEYDEMRASIKKVQAAFASDSLPDGVPDLKWSNSPTKKPGIFLRLLHYPVHLYKVAASILLLTGLFALMNHTGSVKRKGEIAYADTFFIHKTDTIFSRITDTVRVVIMKSRQGITPGQSPGISEIASESIARGADCEAELCPGETDFLGQLSMKGNMANDSMYGEFAVVFR